MESHKQLAILFTLLLCGVQLCKAQQEDTLRLKPRLSLPSLITPSQPIKADKLLVPDKLSLDGLEYLPPTPPDSVGIIPNLSVENFMKHYYNDFLEWEEDTYGWNFDLHQFTRKNGTYLVPSKLTFKKKGLMDSVGEAPYPLPHDPTSFKAAIVIPIYWAPSKHDSWYKENFSWEKRILYNNVSIARYGYRDVTEFQRVQLAGYFIEQRKVELGGIYNPDLSHLKRRIRQLKAKISSKDSVGLPPANDTIR